MKKLLVFIPSFLIGAMLLAQTSFSAPDMKKISKSLSGKNAALYGRLMNRLQTNDTTLSLNDYQLLYYGTALQAGYNPQKDSPLRDTLYGLFSNAQSGRADFREVKKIANQILEQLPFDIRTLDPSIHASRMLNDNATADKLEMRMGRIIETIYNSGDGRTETTPFYVVSTANEVDMLRALGFTPATIIAMQSGNLDFWKVKENDFGIDGFFFKVL
ncbi:MAG TPA: DUF4919 domain-containing protein [Lentimicrobium sp.]|nr:DUF4919 domain-containing protein [Lentimicrobium sp.]